MEEQNKGRHSCKRLGSEYRVKKLLFHSTFQLNTILLFMVVVQSPLGKKSLNISIFEKVFSLNVEKI